MKQSISRKINLIGIGIAALVLLAGINVFGQVEENAKNSTDKTTRSDAKVNPTSLGMELSIPLGNLPGRAGNSLPITYNYSSKVWHIVAYNVPEDGHPAYWATPVYGENSVSGWTSSLQAPWFEDSSLIKESMGSHNPPVCGDGYQAIWKMTMHLGDGSTVEMAANLTPVSVIRCSEPAVTTYSSFDGSNLKWVINAGNQTSTLYMPDGSRYDWSSGALTSHTDRNGNKLLYQLNSSTGKMNWIDTMGRAIPIPPYDSNNLPVAGNVDYKVPTMTGHGDMIWTFKWKKLEDSFENLNGTYSVQQFQYLFNEVYGSQQYEYLDPVVLSELVQPDGRSYKFYYNTYGEIEKIVYPTGATEKFTYSQFGPFSFGGRGQGLTWQGNRGVATRTVSVDSNTANDMTWQYAIPPAAPGFQQAASPYTVKTTNPDGSKTERLLFTDYNGPSSTLSLPSQMGGKEYESRAYATDGTTLVRRELIKWSGASYGTTTGINAYTKVDKKVSITIEGTSALAQNQTLTYDSYLNPTSDTTYDFTVPSLTTAQNGVIDNFSNGTALMTTETSYMTDTNYLARQMVSLPIQKLVHSGSISGTVVAKTEIGYDTQSLVTDVYSTHWENPNTNYRGLVTSTKSWSDIAANQYVETKAQYDTLGNLRNFWDGRNNLTQTAYSATYDYAYPTSVTTPVPDSNGTNGSSTALTTSSTYDYATGLTLSVTDANTQTTTMSYVDPTTNVLDPLLRLRKVTAPNGQQTITEYGDTVGSLYVKVSSQIDDSNWKVGYSWYDGLGRTIKTQSIDNAGDVFALTCYDNMSRVSKASNPFRNISNPTCSSSLEWTTNTFDTTGRPWKITTPDGAIVETTYGLATTGSQIGTTVTFKDQALKERRSVTNALGQLKRVHEPTTAGLGAVDNPNQYTSYVYDTLNNLTTVSQGVQTRTFAYNSLSRLTSATNPESGTINYSYDNNGNLTQKTDARGVKTDYIYDALNRVTNRNYSLVGSTPPNYQASPNVTYTYDNLPNAKGKLTKVSSSVSTTEYVTFDILGRVTRSKQTTDGVVYGTDAAPMTYTYNLSGAMIEQKYPSGRVVKNVLDNDGDLSIVQSKKNAGSGYFNYAKNLTYSAAGAVTSMQLGNGKWESTVFNNRLQPTQIALGTVQNGTDKLKLNYDYGTTANNGNVQTQTITVPGMTYPLIQTYAYDSLNRLDDANETYNGAQTWRQDFTYDRYGNRNFVQANTTMPATFANPAVTNPTISTTNNRITSSGYNYDASGNTTYDAALRKFTYDAENKQTKAESTNSSQQVTGTLGEYFYDGDGKRVKKIAGDEATIFVYDAAGKEIAEYSTIVANSTDAKVAYLTSDHLGSPRINTDANGAVITRHDYHPFGEEIATAQRTTNLGYAADTVRKQFTGYERDIESDLDFAQARYYNKNHGRFTSVDPENAGASADNPQTWNAYAYVGNNPISITDPLGLSWYFNSSIGEAGQYKWYEDNETPADGFHLVNGTSNHVYYAGEGVGYVALNPTANKFQTFDTQDAATKRVGDIYACPSCQSLVNTVADESIKKGTTVAIGAGVAVAVGTGAGVVMYATGAAAGAGITTLGLAEAGTATATTATVATTTAATAETSSFVGRVITGFTKHGINQAISRDGVGVSARAILNAVKEPIKVTVQNNGTVRFVGKEATVILNQAGKVITTWARSGAGTRITP